MAEALGLAVVRSYAVGPPRTVAVRLVGGLETLLGAVPVAAHVDSADLTVGRECVVAFTEPTDYRSAVVVGVVGTPAGAGGGDLLPNYWNPQRGDPEVILPSSGWEARGTAVLGGWGAWVVVEAATAQALVLVAAHLSKVSTGSASLWVQVGVDPAGGVAYTVRAELAFHVGVAGAGSYPIHTSTFRLAPYLVPAGSRVAMRGWVSAADLRFQGYLALVRPAASWYTPWPNTYIAGGRATNQRRVPVVAGWLAVPGGPGWVQAVAAAANNMLVCAAEVDPASGSGLQGDVVEVGVGAPGAEVVFSRVGIPSFRVFGWPVGYQEFGRKALVLAGERVAVQTWLAGGPYGVALYFEDL
jgi:hypothetical protein